MYKLLRKGFNSIICCLSLLLPVISFSANNWGGNCVEEHTIFTSSSNYIPNHELTETRAFMKDVPSSFKNSFVGYNAEIDYYLYDHIKPACRFFVLQDFAASQSSSLQKYLIEYFQKNKPKWFLYKDMQNILHRY